MAELNTYEQTDNETEIKLALLILVLWIIQVGVMARLILFMLICCRYLERCFGFKTRIGFYKITDK